MSTGQKTPIARTLNQFAENKVRGLLELTGKSLPASVVSRAGAVVTVKFEITSDYTLQNITVPMIGSEYIRLPIQAGCLGWVMTADAYLGGVSGLGGGVADLSQRANLSMLVWSPIGNKNWTASEDDNAVVIYGPDGTVIRNTAKTAMIKVTTSDNSWTAPAGAPVTINGPLIVKGPLMLQGGIESDTGGVYAGAIHTSGAVVAGFGTGDAVGLQSHTHTQPNDSHNDVEQPTAAPTGGT